MVKAPLLLNPTIFAALLGSIPSKLCKSLAELVYSRERNGHSPTRKCELVMCRASTQVYALVRIIECQKRVRCMSSDLIGAV